MHSPRHATRPLLALLATSVALTCLSACGQTGALYLPDAQRGTTAIPAEPRTSVGTEPVSDDESRPKRPAGETPPATPPQGQ